MTSSDHPASSASSWSHRNAVVRATAALALVVVGLAGTPIAQAAPDTNIQKPGHVTVTVSRS